MRIHLLLDEASAHFLYQGEGGEELKSRPSRQNVSLGEGGDIVLQFRERRIMKKVSAWSIRTLEKIRGALLIKFMEVETC